MWAADAVTAAAGVPIRERFFFSATHPPTNEMFNVQVTVSSPARPALEQVCGICGDKADADLSFHGSGDRKHCSLSHQGPVAPGVQ